MLKPKSLPLCGIISVSCNSRVRVFASLTCSLQHVLRDSAVIQPTLKVLLGSRAGKNYSPFRNRSYSAWRVASTAAALLADEGGLFQSPYTRKYCQKVVFYPPASACTPLSRSPNHCLLPPRSLSHLKPLAVRSDLKRGEPRAFWPRASIHKR